MGSKKKSTSQMNRAKKRRDVRAKANETPEKFMLEADTQKTTIAVTPNAAVSDKIYDDIAIKVSDVTKKFKVFFDKGQSFKEKILFKNRNRYEDRWVLKGISVEVKKGEAIGLIGENGCGKSTLLKLMTKIIYPDNGRIEMKGRISSLIELGAGFHPDMSGRENIYINASIFGLTRREIDSRVQDIIDFSELHEFIDNPVRTYSSGMYMRLAFSVAISVDADILLVDEILAVGDANFQAKCFNKMRDIKASGTTIVLVSHSLGQVEQICDRSVWICNGKIKMEGNPRDIHPYYLDFMGNKIYGEQCAKLKAEETQETLEPKEIEEIEEKEEIQETQETKENKAEEVEDVENKNGEDEVVLEPIENNRWGNGLARMTDVYMLNEAGKRSNIFKTGEKVDIVIEYNASRRLEQVAFGIGIFRNDGVNCYGTNTHIDRVSNINIQGTGKAVCNISNLELIGGEYKLDVAIHTPEGFAFDYCKDYMKFRVYSKVDDVGIVHLNHRWEISSK